MNTLVWIKNGHIIDPANKREGTGNLYIKEGKIVSALSENEIKKAEIIDAKGLVVCPGFVDIHCHLREPGQTHKEDIATGSLSAAAGGFTTLVCMPDTSPPASTPGTIQLIQDAIRSKSRVHIYPTGCLTVNMEGTSMAPLGSLKNAGVVAFTDNRNSLQKSELMKRIMEYARMLDIPVLDGCQEISLSEGAVMNEGTWSLRLGLKGWPNAAEDIMVSRNSILSHYTKSRFHIQSISSSHALSLVRKAKKQGTPISCEVTPHHLFFTDKEMHSYDPHFKVSPPFRTEKDRKALIKGLKNGTIDCIVTDHSPHTDYEIDCELDYAPYGIIGFETALGAILEILYHRERHLSLSECISFITDKPAKLLKLDAGTLSVGATADITIIDPNESWTVGNSFQSKSTNTPFRGQTLRGKVKRTLVSGKTVWNPTS